MIPVVIFHIGNHAHFQICVRANAAKNKVLVIGDASNAYVGNWDNVEHIMADTLQTQETELFEQHFINYSPNNAVYERRCFVRVFYIGRLLELRNLDAVFHLDSDCVLLERLETILSTLQASDGSLRPAYNCNQVVNKARPSKMSASIHNGLLTPAFCAAFQELCYAIYVSGDKFSLIEPKIEWHRDQRQPGGICDMTLYHLLAADNALDVLDLEMPLALGSAAVFTHNINSGVGYKGAETFKMYNGKQLIEKREDQYYLVDAENGERVRALSLHFQGGAKQAMQSILANGNAPRS